MGLRAWCEIAQLVKAPAAKSEDLSSSPRSHVTPQSCPLTSSSLPWHLHSHTAHTYAHEHIKLKPNAQHASSHTHYDATIE